MVTKPIYLYNGYGCSYIINAKSRHQSKSNGGIRLKNQVMYVKAGSCDPAFTFFRIYSIPVINGRIFFGKASSKTAEEGSCES